MKKKALIKKFEEMFPQHASDLSTYKKIGSRVIKITPGTNHEHSLFFMYYDENNWQLGTKIYRRRPVKKADAVEEETWRELNDLA